MTFPASMAHRPATKAPSNGPRATDTTAHPTATPVVPKRVFEIVAHRMDGSMYVGQHRAPALPLLEQAFSAFARDTLIDTDTGAVAIEDLQPGDWVKTETGASAQVQWIGSSNFVPADAGRRTPLIRIMNDSFGMGRPSTFLTVGPSARVLHMPQHLRGDTDGLQILTPLREFIDGVNVIEVTPPTPVRLFHLCLTRHAVINAGGLLMETFHPGLTAAAGISDAQRDHFLSLFPHISDFSDFGPLAHPHAPAQTPTSAPAPQNPEN